MDWVTASLDLVFLVLAIALFPRHVLPTVGDEHVEPTPPTSAHLLSPLISSGMRSSASSSLSIPGISITSPVLPSGGGSPSCRSAASRQRQKRKSVSFSISSMEGLNSVPRTPHEVKLRRPPTPFVRPPPVSPSELSTTDTASAVSTPIIPVLSAPPTPMGVTGAPAIESHSAELKDPMGVQKKWLMA